VDRCDAVALAPVLLAGGRGPVLVDELARMSSRDSSRCSAQRRSRVSRPSSPSSVTTFIVDVQVIVRLSVRERSGEAKLVSR
jgi:hypothetical protein